MSAAERVAEYSQRFNKDIKILAAIEIDSEISQCLYHEQGGDLILAEYDGEQMHEITLEGDIIDAIVSFTQEVA